MSSVNSCQWLELKIGEVADVIAGGTPKAGNPDNFKAPGTGIAWLTPADLSDHTRKNISFGARDLSHQGYNSSSAKIMPKGSLLFSSRAPIGYVAIAQNDISTNQGFKSFVFPYGVNSDYAYYYLRSIRGVAESFGTGTTFKEISGATAKSLPFLLPPLAEQIVIADKLDTLLAQVENTKSSLKRILDSLKGFRQSVLAAAVKGKLTEEWRTKQEGSFTWQKIILSDVAKIIDPHPSHRTPVEVSEGVPYIGIGDIREDGTINFESARKVSHEILREHNERYTLKDGDFIFGKIGTLGKVTPLPLGINYTLSANVILIQPIADVMHPVYLQYFLSSPSTMNEISQQANSTSQIAFGIKKMRSFSCELPSINEQTEIVHRVKKLFTFANNIEEQACMALERVNKLTQSIIAKAFRGELTAEWRAENPKLISGDNSAEALLEKIKTERDALKKQPKTKLPIEKKKGSRMSKQIIKVVDALKQAKEPLSGQQLLAAAGYPRNSGTDQLEQFFLDIREALTIEKSIVKLKRSDDGQDWFSLAETVETNKV